MTIEQKIEHYRNNGFPRIWVSDLGNGSFRNPVLHTDYSDPDIICVGSDFYMTASTFNNVPALPILHSKDLVNWTLINYAVKERLPGLVYDKPQYGKGVWAPSLRYHNGYFYIYVGFPDEGIFMTRTRNIEEDWEPLVCLKEGKGYIDTCPLWDDDGSAYLVHAFAKSRIGFKSVLAVNKMNADGTALTDEFRIVYDGNAHNPTIEGPKFYKRNGYYYISAPAGGVPTGWQIILRSRHVYGPYEEKIVLHQGDSIINGPHQGGWVETEAGECWFMHFQDKDAYGRICHLQPVNWVEDWPMMGVDTNGDGIGEPVLQYPKPVVSAVTDITAPVVSDEFDSHDLGLQWQWNANKQEGWYSLTENPGYLRLFACNSFQGESPLLWNMPNLLTQKFPAYTFQATAKFSLHLEQAGEKAGLGITGDHYAAIEITKGIGETYYLNHTIGCYDMNGVAEYVCQSVPLAGTQVYLRVDVTPGGICHFSYSINGENFSSFDQKHKACVSKWVGSKVCMFCSGVKPGKGFVDIDWFLVEE